MTILAGDNHIPTQCNFCNQPIQSWGMKGVFIVPEHGFLADSKTGKPTEQPPERIYSSRIYFSHYSPAQDKISAQTELELEEDPAFSSKVPVYKGYSRFAWLASVNNGYGQGFKVCTTCGYADVIEPDKSSKRTKVHLHKNPLSREDCTGSFTHYHLGHRFMTDVLELRMRLELPREEQVLSFLYAILNGASDSLALPRDDIGGVVYYTKGSPSFILFDNTPGGSGYVKYIYENLRKVFEAAYRRVSTCNGCSPDTSCYSCLRSYDNQIFHDKLERRLALEILKDVLG